MQISRTRLQYAYTVISLHPYTATSLHPYTATSLHPYIATSLHPYIATPVHRYIDDSPLEYSRRTLCFSQDVYKPDFRKRHFCCRRVFSAVEQTLARRGYLFIVRVVFVSTSSRRKRDIDTVKEQDIDNARTIV